MLAKPALNGIISPRGPPVSDSRWLASTKATSLKASVAMAKKGPRRRKVGQEISIATPAESAAIGSMVSHGDQPKLITSPAVRYAPMPKNTPWASENWPPKPPMMFHAAATPPIR